MKFHLKIKSIHFPLSKLEFFLLFHRNSLKIHVGYGDGKCVGLQQIELFESRNRSSFYPFEQYNLVQWSVRIYLFSVNSQKESDKICVSRDISPMDISEFNKEYSRLSRISIKMSSSVQSYPILIDIKISKLFLIFNQKHHFHRKIGRPGSFLVTCAGAFVYFILMIRFNENYICLCRFTHI